jgi:hypothetical protein
MRFGGMYMLHTKKKPKLYISRGNNNILIVKGIEGIENRGIQSR